MFSHLGISYLSDDRVLIFPSPAKQILWSFPCSTDAEFYKGCSSVFKDLSWAPAAQHKAVQSK